jgi:hypothetical protein
MYCYFDTSIFNWIFQDEQKDLILKKIVDKGLNVIPSVINKCEILLNSDEEHKKNLLNLYEEIRRDYFTAKAPPHLLEDATTAIQEGKNEIEFTYPIVEDEELEKICRELKKISGVEIEKAIVKAREFIEKKIDEIKIANPISYFKYLDGEGIKVQILLFKNLCLPLNIKLKLNDKEIVSLIQSYMIPWKYFLDSYLFFLYRRILKLENYGIYKNPGHSDLEQCIYLYWAKMFVLKDGRFYEFLKDLSELRGYDKEILTYDDFKKYLGIA